MNFDNLVEDAVKLGAVKYNGVLIIDPEKIKVLLTKYILADRAVSGEAVAYRFPKAGINNGYNYMDDIDGVREDIADRFTPLFTRAQPTPAQIAEIQAQTEVAYQSLEARNQINLGVIQHLTAQNAKLMEALEVILDSSLLVGSTELHDKVLKQTYSAIHSNITPQPEKEGKEKDPHQDLLDSWGPSA